MNLVTQAVAESALEAIVGLMNAEAPPRNARVKLSAAVRILEQYRWQVEQDPHHPSRYIRHFLDLFGGNEREALRWLGTNYDQIRSAMRALPEHAEGSQ